MVRFEAASVVMEIFRKLSQLESFRKLSQVETFQWKVSSGKFPVIFPNSRPTKTPRSALQQCAKTSTFCHWAHRLQFIS